MSVTTRKEISLDFYNTNIVTVNAKQYDTESRFINISCTDHGKKVDLDKENVSAFVRYKKPDDKYVFNDATVEEDGTVTVELTQQMLAVPGKCAVDVLLIGASGIKADSLKTIDAVYKLSPILSTMTFYLNVLPTPIEHSTVESRYEFNALLNGMARLVSVEEHMEELDATLNDNEDARKNAENERVKAEDLRVDAENTRVQGENNRIANEILRIEAENGRNTAELERAYAEQLRVNAENARVEAENARVDAETLREQNVNTAISDCNEAADDARDATQGLVDKVEAKITEVDNTVTSWETHITQTAEEVAITAAKEEISTSLDGYVTETEMESAIKVSADSITSTVSETYQTKDAMSDYSTTTEMESAIELSAKAITSSVSETYQTKDGMGDYVKSTTFTQTSEDFTAKIEGAEKTATDCLRFSEDGLVVGDMTGTALGNNVLVSADGVYIRNGDTTLASFDDDTIELGKGNSDAIISLCDGNAKFSYTDGGAPVDSELTLSSTTYTTLDSQFGVKLYSHHDYGSFAYAAYIDVNDGYISMGSMYDGNGDDVYDEGSSFLTMDNDSMYLSVSYVELDVPDGLQLYNNVKIYGHDADGNLKECFNAQNGSGDTVIGHGNYESRSGNTSIRGQDVYLFVGSAGATNHKPYYTAGDSITFNIPTTGYVTSDKSKVYFSLSLDKPVLGSPTVTASSVSGFTLRQGTEYTHGTAYGSPVATGITYQASLRGSMVTIVAGFSNTTNATNNDAIGVEWSGKITFS